jgi:hypothetical protein
MVRSGFHRIPRAHKLLTMENKSKKPMPTPEERPDLYDYYDGSGRPLFAKAGIGVPDRIQKLIDERQKARSQDESPKLIYIENEGAIFRGIDRAWPKEVWDGTKLVPYRGNVPKDIEWGKSTRPRQSA